MTYVESLLGSQSDWITEKPDTGEQTKNCTITTSFSASIPISYVSLQLKARAWDTPRKNWDDFRFSK